MKKAFTLAEVLITLGIIGIIAAMTLPALIGRYNKKKVLQEQFKVAYTILQQAYLKIEADWGYTPDCYYWDKNPYGSCKCIEHDDRGACIKWSLPDGSKLPDNYNGNMGDCKLFYKSLEKTIQVINKCEGNAYRKGCIPEYEGIDTIQQANSPGTSDNQAHAATGHCAGFRKTNILNNKTAIVFKNGMIMVPYSTTGTPVFLFDINGKKGPNKWGYDIFVFQARGNPKGPLKVDSGTCSAVEKGGLSTKEMIKNMYGTNYNK